MFDLKESHSLYKPRSHPTADLAIRNFKRIIGLIRSGAIPRVCRSGQFDCQCGDREESYRPTLTKNLILGDKKRPRGRNHTRLVGYGPTQLVRPKKGVMEGSESWLWLLRRLVLLAAQEVNIVLISTRQREVTVGEWKSQDCVKPPSSA